MANLRFNKIHKTVKAIGVLSQHPWPPRNLSFQSKSGSESDSDLPEPPTECCNSGCDNCVWIVYAEELLKKFSNGGELVRATIKEKVKDPSMQAFLLAELKALEKENEEKQ